MKWSAKIIKHKCETRIAVNFEKNTELINRIKKLDGARWSSSLSVWHLPATVKNRILFKLLPASDFALSQDAILEIEKFKQWLRSRRYSENTIKTYSEAIRSFMLFYREKPAAEITNEDVII